MELRAKNSLTASVHVTDTLKIEVGGDFTNEDGLLEGTLTEYTNDRVKSVRPGFFESDATLQIVTLPYITELKERTFYSATALVTANLQNIYETGSNVFYNCSKLKNINAPKLRILGKSAFLRCTSLESVSFPSMDTSYGAAFSSCSALKFADLAGLVSIGVTFFFKCSSLRTIVLRNPQYVCSISNSNAFGRTPFESGNSGGVALVPAALIESYQIATNWSTFYTAGTCTFLPLEEYTLDGTITGDIDMDKVEAKLNELYGGETA